MKTLTDRVSERLVEEMQTRPQENVTRINELTDRFARMEQQGLVAKDQFMATSPSALMPLMSTPSSTLMPLKSQ